MNGLHCYTIKHKSNVDNIQKQLSDLVNRVHDLITSTRGREILLFLVFLLISYIFWLLLTLNNEVQEDLEVPITSHQRTRQRDIDIRCTPRR